MGDDHLFGWLGILSTTGEGPEPWPWYRGWHSRLRQVANVPSILHIMRLDYISDVPTLSIYHPKEYCIGKPNLGTIYFAPPELNTFHSIE